MQTGPVGEGEGGGGGGGVGRTDLCTCILRSLVGMETVLPRRPGGIVVCWLLNVPATYECISGTDLLRQFYVLPH